MTLTLIEKLNLGFISLTFAAGIAGTIGIAKVSEPVFSNRIADESKLRPYINMMIYSGIVAPFALGGMIASGYALKKERKNNESVKLNSSDGRYKSRTF